MSADTLVKLNDLILQYATNFGLKIPGEVAGYPQPGVRHINTGG